jgi:PAS domain S-box-containing protein
MTTVGAIIAEMPNEPGQTSATLSRQLDASALRLLINNVSDYGIFLLDPAGHVATWNTGAARMHGYQPDEIIGKHLSVFYPQEAIARNWPAKELEIAARDGRFEDEGWRVRKDGTEFWANVVITAVRDHTGELIAFGKVSRDLTDRRRADQQLRESEERFRLLVESTLDYAIFRLDPQGNIASWNLGAQRIKGYTADEIIGRHFSTFYAPEAVATGWPAYELEQAQSVGRFEDEGWRVRKDGSRFWANVVITAMRGADGALRGYAKVTRDISERKAHEERIQKLTHELQQRVTELATANYELEQKSSENESFVYSVSHDLRSPLVNLQGFSHELALASDSLKALLADPAVPPEIRSKGLALIGTELAESLEFIRNSVRHLGNIIDGLLRLARVGRVEYEVETVDVGAVVADILSSIHTTVVSSGARIDLHELPFVRGDRNAIGQIFANLVGNSLKSLDPHRAGVVEISATDADPPIFSVRDNGVGIPSEYRSKMFQVFQQVHESRARGEGMGLAIVRRIVERHGGRIWFESVPGQGTTFSFSLAAASPAAASDHVADRE